jgi:acyl carrier protein
MGFVQMSTQNFETEHNRSSNSDKADRIVNFSDLPTALEIQAWMVAYLSGLLEIAPERIDVRAEFVQFGLDSAAIVGFTGDLEDWLGFGLSPTLPYDYPTIAQLAQHLSELSASSHTKLS